MNGTKTSLENQKIVGNNQINLPCQKNEMLRAFQVHTHNKSTYPEKPQVISYFFSCPLFLTAP